MPAAPSPVSPGPGTSLTLRMLRDAARKCARGTRWKDSVAGYVCGARLLRNSERMRRSLADGTYRLSGYTVFQVTEPKRRLVRSPMLRDRIVQRAMCDNGLYEDLTRGCLCDNCACQLGKGTLHAVRRLQAHVRRFSLRHRDGWAVRLDIRRFFDSLPHDGLKELVRRRVRSREFADRVVEIVDSYGPGPGIGLGSQVSQLLAVAYLSPVDHLAKERLGLREYVRYSDDVVFLAPDREAARSAWLALGEAMEARGLELNRKSCMHPLRQGVRFLKLKIVATAPGATATLLGAGCVRRERRRLRAMAALGRPAAALDESFVSWRSHALWARSHKATREMERWLRTM